MKGTHYLLLKNADKLSEKQSDKLQRLLESNSNLNALYVLKEQLQLLWSAASFEAMAEQLERWCLIADQSQMLYLKKFAKSLRKHCVGICNYAKHKLTSARIEAGNVSIGMIRKRARGKAEKCLIAEITSAMVSSLLGFGSLPRADHFHYVKNWLDVLCRASTTLSGCVNHLGRF